MSGNPVVHSTSRPIFAARLKGIDLPPKYNTYIFEVYLNPTEKYLFWPARESADSRMGQFLGRPAPPGIGIPWWAGLSGNWPNVSTVNSRYKHAPRGPVHV